MGKDSTQVKRTKLTSDQDGGKKHIIPSDNIAAIIIANVVLRTFPE